MFGQLKRAAGALVIIAVATLSTVLAPSVFAAAGTYNEPFGTRVNVGSTSCETKTIYWQTKTVHVEIPSIDNVPSYVSNIRLTVWTFSQASGATKATYEPALSFTYLGHKVNHEGFANPSVQFPVPVQDLSIRWTFSGQIGTWERLEYLNAQGVPYAGGTIDLAPSYYSWVQTYPTSDPVMGDCRFWK